MADSSALAHPLDHFPFRLPVRVTEPDRDALARFAASTADAPFNYPHVGAAGTGAPAGYATARVSERVGRGEECFARLCDAIDAWEVFDQSWLRLLPVERPPRPRMLVTFASYQVGVWMLHPCRIVEVEHHTAPDEAVHGILYGTLKGHVLSGEERISARWNRITDEVHAEIFSFARPGHPIAGLFSPITRASRARFRAGALPILKRVGAG